MSERLFDNACPIVAQPGAAEEIPRTPCSSAGGFVADSSAVSVDAPAPSEVASCAYDGDREVQIAPPALTAPPVEPEELAGGGDIAPGPCDVGEYGGGGCPAPAQCEPAGNQSRVLVPPLQDDSEVISNGGSGGDSGGNIRGGSSHAQVLCTRATADAGGFAAPKIETIGAGGGEAAGSHALLLESSMKAAPLCNGGAPARRGGAGGGGEAGRSGAGMAEWAPRAMAMNNNVRTRKIQTGVGGGGNASGSGRYFSRRSSRPSLGSAQRNADIGVGCSVGDGRFVSRRDNSLRRACAAPRTTTVGTNAVGGPPRHYRPTAAIEKGGARSSMHEECRHGRRGAGGQGRHGRGRRTPTTGSGNRGRASNKHGSSSSNFSRHQAQSHPRQQWVKGIGQAAAPAFYRSGFSGQSQHVQCGRGGTRPAYPSTQAQHSLYPRYNVPMYTGGGGGWGNPLAQVPMPVVSWAPYFPCHPVVPAAFPGYWQRVCMVR